MSVLTFIYRPSAEFLMAALHKVYAIFKEEKTDE
jgi:hypothetical protein